jgi:hypothetical protein
MYRNTFFTELNEHLIYTHKNNRICFVFFKMYRRLYFYKHFSFLPNTILNFKTVTNHKKNSLVKYFCAIVRETRISRT